MTLIPPVNGTDGVAGRFNSHCFFGDWFLELMARKGTAVLGFCVMNPSDATASGRLFHG